MSEQVAGDVPSWQTKCTATSNHDVGEVLAHTSFLIENGLNGCVDIGALGLIDKVRVNLIHERIECIKDTLTLKHALCVVIEQCQCVDVGGVK